MKQKTKQKVITEREIIRFRQCLYKAEKSPSTIDKYVRDVRKLQQYADGRILTKTLMLEYKRDLEVSSTYKATSINRTLQPSINFVRQCTGMIYASKRSKCREQHLSPKKEN